MVRFLWIMVWLSLDFTKGATGTKDGEDWMPITDPRQKLPKLQNVSLLITYANNMFGPSMKVKTNKESIIFAPPSTNRTLYLGQTMKTTRSSQDQRTKRGVLHLYNMVSCATGCNPLIYKGYGCYCGFLGSGYAVDGIDRCCKMHDQCYDTAKCPMFLEYIVPYFWKCYYNRPLCAIDHGEFGGPGSCASRLCECDRVLSECLSQYPCPSSRALCRSSPLRLLQNAFMIFP